MHSYNIVEAQIYYPRYIYIVECTVASVTGVKCIDQMLNIDIDTINT